MKFENLSSFEVSHIGVCIGACGFYITCMLLQPNDMVGMGAVWGFSFAGITVPMAMHLLGEW